MKLYGSTLVVHCGILNDGQLQLIKSYAWNIWPVKNINENFEEIFKNHNIRLILIDESQRIKYAQLIILIKTFQKFEVPMIFSYDKDQYLKENESKDIYEIIHKVYPAIPLLKETLTDKIRTNKNISSFITNLFIIGKSNSFLNYENITIEYFDNLADIKEYIRYLETYKGWKAITYTNSSYSVEPIDDIAMICDTNAHDVIGQEFDKVVFVMDENFRYNKDGILTARKNYYSPKGMLFQIVTRVVNQLKILVLHNPKLYYQLLKIKSFDKSH